MESNITINILSDSLGNTAESVARAALAQFNVQNADFVKIPYVKNDANLDRTLEEIKIQSNPIILYTIVNPEIIEKIKKFAARNAIGTADILTESISIIKDALGVEPSTQTGMLRKLNNLYFKRVECIEFAVKYDDGKDPRGILLADLVIVGISRTSKTPLSMYIANKNIKVCNVPIVPEAQLPSELFTVDASKIVGLTNSPEKLEKIRSERLKSLGLPPGSMYSKRERIIEEISIAEQLMKRLGCPIINVSDKAIEETAEIIISYLKKNQVKLGYIE